jgi:hypothetical protein
MEFRIETNMAEVRRQPKGRTILIPGGVKLNKYGNIPKGALRRLQAEHDTFIASRSDPNTRRLAPGIYRRAKKKRKAGGRGAVRLGAPALVGRVLTALVGFADRAIYRRRFPFERIAERKAKASLQPNFTAAMRGALATAR